MIHYHDVEQGTDEWFSLRVGSLGASRAKDALAGGAGKTRTKLVYQLAGEKVTNQKENSFQSAAMAEGIRREPESRAFFEFEMGIQLEQTGIITNDDFPGCHISPDGFNRELAIGFEVKNPTMAVHIEYLLKGTVPSVYKKQVLYSMLITGFKSWYFMSYFPGLQPLILKVDNGEDVAAMEAGIRKFTTDTGIIAEELRAFKQ